MKGKRILKMPLTQCLIASLILSSFAMFASASAGKPPPPTDRPINMHLSWDRSDTAHTMVVSWQTTGNIASEVKYDTVSHGGTPSAYAYSATGNAHGWPTSRNPSGYVHDVLLTGLTPDTVYYYICGSASPSGGYSAEYGFRTAPTGTTASFSFVAGGDSRTDQTNRELVSKAMALKSPRFILHVGDYMSSDLVRLYSEWMSDVNNNWITPGNLRIPMWGTIGNHESAGTCILGQYAWPPGPSNNERWYSVDYGDLVHIICLSDSYNTVSSQTAWLQSDLQANQNKPWKFAFFHEPAYVSGSTDTNRTDVIQAWCPLFEQYGVNIVFAGDCHIYQRTYPFMGSPNAHIVSNPADGTNYVVSAGWGAPLYTGIPQPWIAYTESIYHYCLIQVNGATSLTLTMYDQSNVAHDSLTITKT